jgi:hypothetical protein
VGQLAARGGRGHRATLATEVPDERRSQRSSGNAPSPWFGKRRGQEGPEGCGAATAAEGDPGDATPAATAPAEAAGKVTGGFCQ